MTKPLAKLTEADLVKRIAARSEFQNGYFMPQFTLEGRRADAVWLDGFKMTMTGFEVKCSRGDWLNELKDPWKSHAVGKFCNQWYLVVATRDLVKPDELPKNWGLMVAHGHSTKIIKHAPFNKTPEEWTKELFVRVVRKIKPMHEQSEEDALRSEGRQAGYTQGFEIAKERFSKDGPCEELEKLKALHDRFKEITGVSISAWNMEDIAGDLVLLQELGKDGIRRQANRLAMNMESRAVALRRLIGDDPDPEGDVVGDSGSAEVIRGIALQLLRFDEPLRRAATTLDGLTAIVDAPVPTIAENYLHTAWLVAEPVARLLGQDITVGLVRRIAQALQENSHGESGNSGVARKRVSG